MCTSEVTVVSEVTWSLLFLWKIWLSPGSALARGGAWADSFTHCLSPFLWHLCACTCIHTHTHTRTQKYVSEGRKFITPGHSVDPGFLEQQNQLWKVIDTIVILDMLPCPIEGMNTMTGIKYSLEPRKWLKKQRDEFSP